MDVIAIGDTTEDIFLQLHDASLQCAIDGGKCMLSLDYGEKIATEKKTVIAGVGNAANHAIGIARLGLKSGIYTIVGDDDQGHEAKNILDQNNVDTTRVVFDSEHGTNLSIVINFRSERTILVYHEPRTYVLPELGNPLWLYLTSVSGGGVSELHNQVLVFMAKNPTTKLAFNPGTHQIKLGREALLPVLQKTEILFLSLEEASQVLEMETRDVKVLVKSFHDLDITTVVITDGSVGSYVSDGRNIYMIHPYPAKVVETTGSGDAYGSGFLAAIIKGKTILEAMQWGCANASSVVQYVGAQEGLLEEDAIAHIIKEYADITPRIFDTL